MFFINKSQNYVCFLSHHASHSFIPNTRGPPFINFGPICHPHQILALGPLWTNLKHNEARLSKFSSLWVLGAFFLCFVISKSQNYVFVHNFLSHQASYSFIPNTRGSLFINFRPICHPVQILAPGPLWTNLKHNEARFWKFSSLWIKWAFFVCFFINNSQNYVFVHNFLSHQASYSFIPNTRGPPIINFGPVCHPHQILAPGPLWTNFET